LEIGGAFLGFVTGILAAFYFPFAWTSSLALSETVGTFLITWQLLVALRIVDEKRPLLGRSFVLLGVLTALVGLTRPAYVLWAIVPVALVIVRRRTSLARISQLGALAVVGFVLVMSPWWVRNTVTLHHFIPLSSSSGEAKLMGVGGHTFTAQEKALYDRENAAGRDGAEAVADARLAAEWNASPAEFVLSRSRSALTSVAWPFLAPDVYYYLEANHLIQPRFEIRFGPEVPNAPPALQSAEAFTAGYHSELVMMALLGLLFVRRWPRLLLSASLVGYGVFVHVFILFISRFFFPVMPALILVAAATPCGIVLAVREALAIQSGPPPEGEAGASPFAPIVFPHIDGHHGHKATANTDVCVIVPVYNEATVVGDVVEKLLERFPNVVTVDDGSTDGTAAVLAATGTTLVRHPFNMGQGAALQTGIERALLDADFNYFVTFDSDGQHRVEDAEAMVNVLREGDVDVVLGSRFLGHSVGMPPLKRFSLHLARWLMNVTTGTHLTDAHNGLRAFNRRFAEGLHLRENGMAHASEIVSYVAHGGFRYREWPVEITYTEYSIAKGQSLTNGINILFDMMFGAFRRK
jgi:hypothetical protein